MRILNTLPFRGSVRLSTNLDFLGILNTLPVRAKVKANHSPLLLPLQGVGVYTLIPRALPWAENWLPFQGARGEGCGASTVAHFARKVRATNT